MDRHEVEQEFQLLSGKWVLPILGELEQRACRPIELRQAIGGLSEKVLHQTLHRLLDHGLITHRTLHMTPRMVEYRLTPAGQAAVHSAKLLNHPAHTGTQFPVPLHVDKAGEQPMTDREPIADIDPNTPNAARMYDYYLGGKDNYAADRVAAEAILQILPEVRDASWDNRKFLQRAVRHLVEERHIRQFIDIGTGLPTQGSVHEVVQRTAPDARVVYLDNDPVVLSHARALLASNHHSKVSVIHGDLRDPTRIIRDLSELIDFDQPVAILLVAILHFITDDDDPRAILAQLRAAMTPDSHLVLSHATSASRPHAITEVTQLYQHTTAPITFRTHSQILKLFDGFELLDPGLAYVQQWRNPAHQPNFDPTSSLSLAGVAHPRLMRV